MTMQQSRLPDLLAGVYQHYKGPLYQVFGYAHDANFKPDGSESVTYDDARMCVVYMGLELTGAHGGPRLAVRTAQDFFQRVHPDGSSCDSQTCQMNHNRRFTYIGPALTL